MFWWSANTKDRYTPLSESKKEKWALLKTQTKFSRAFLLINNWYKTRTNVSKNFYSISERYD